MTNFLLDTNVCIHYLKGYDTVVLRLQQAGKSNCAISEITVAELLFGITNSSDPERIRPSVEKFIGGIEVISIGHCLRLFAQEKARLNKAGLMIPDFDLLIGCTAITSGRIMVTNNVKHLGRIEGIELQDWKSTS